MPWFLCVCSTSFLKTLWEKKKLLLRSNSSFSHSVFLPFRKTSHHFPQLQNCRLQTLKIWTSVEFVVWERVTTLKFKFSTSVYHLFYKTFVHICRKQHILCRLTCVEPFVSFYKMDFRDP